jgi:LAO/AO transport system kinase
LVDAINPNFKKLKKGTTPLAAAIAKPLLGGHRWALSQGLTLVESKLVAHRQEAEKLVHQIMPHTGKAIRIGITGVPGVGKSTFIEAFGELLIKKGHKLAVLAIDPSSAKSRGSILGDKTRMEILSQNEKAFIRPSPSSGSLGGVARKTRESILLCEAAGYDVILIETVGVGQSETSVKNMVDFFMLLMLAGAGDELQGIKRGIMEMADLLVINKADDPNDSKVRLAMGEYKRALHLFPPNRNEWIPKVLGASAIKQTGIEAIWETILSFKNQQELKGYLQQNRSEQALNWFHDALGELLLNRIQENETYTEKYQLAENQVKNKTLEPNAAAHQLINEVWKN